MCFNKKIQELLQNNPNLINNITLFHKKFPIDLIEQNLSKLNIGNILITQDLDIHFIIKWILFNPDITHESYANIETICYYQKNINKSQLIEFYKN